MLSFSPTLSPPPLPAALAGQDAPVTPDADEARRWAVEELSKQSYQDARPGLLAQLLEQLMRFLDDLLTSVSGALNLDPAVVLIGGLLLLLGVIALIVIVARPRLAAQKRGHTEQIFAAAPLWSAQEHRRAAEAAALEQRYRAAIIERFRAIARSAEERVLLSPQPGRTADELAAQLSSFFPAESDRLRQAGDLFNRSRYSGSASPSTRPESAEAAESLRLSEEQAYAALAELDSALLQSRPTDTAETAGTDWVPAR